MIPVLLAQQTTTSASPLAGVFMLLIYLGAALFMIAPIWNIFEKAGRPGWMSLIPILNVVVLLQVVGRPGWWLVLLLVPGVNIVIGILLNIDLAKSFGKGAGFGIGLTILAPIFLLMLGFSESKYVGPAAAA